MAPVLFSVCKPVSIVNRGGFPEGRAVPPRSLSDATPVIPRPGLRGRADRSGGCNAVGALAAPAPTSLSPVTVAGNTEKQAFGHCRPMRRPPSRSTRSHAGAARSARRSSACRTTRRLRSRRGWKRWPRTLGSAPAAPIAMPTCRSPSPPSPSGSWTISSRAVNGVLGFNHLDPKAKIVTQRDPVLVRDRDSGRRGQQRGVGVRYTGVPSRSGQRRPGRPGSWIALTAGLPRAAATAPSTSMPAERIRQHLHRGRRQPRPECKAWACCPTMWRCWPCPSPVRRTAATPCRVCDRPIRRQLCSRRGRPHGGRRGLSDGALSGEPGGQEGERTGRDRRPHGQDARSDRRGRPVGPQKLESPSAG